MESECERNPCRSFLLISHHEAPVADTVVGGHNIRETKAMTFSSEDQERVPKSRKDFPGGRHSGKASALP